MKTLIRLMVISVLMFVAAPAWSDAAIHLYHCELEDEAHDDALTEIASKWLEVARGMKGGENLQVNLYFPIAVEMGESDFIFMVVAPSFAEMGAFLDAYADSPLEDVDDEFDKLAVCPHSTMWESIPVE
jgi:hypothetical protein